MKKIIASLFLVPVLTVPVLAQKAGSALQQQQNSSTFREIQAPKMTLGDGDAVPQMYEGEDKDVGPQRLLKLKARRTWVEGYADSQLYWSDNVTLNGGTKTDSTIWVNTVQAAFAPTGLTLQGRPILPRAGIRGQWYNYGVVGNDSDGTLRLHSFDFFSQTVFLDTRYRLTEQWSVGVGVDYSRLSSLDEYVKFYEDVTPRWDAEWRHELSQNKVIALAYQGNYHVGETIQPVIPALGPVPAAITPKHINDRTEQAFTATYSQEIVPKLVLQPYYRLQYTYFTGPAERSDWQNTFGVSLGYYFNRWASVRTFAAYDIKNSGDDNTLPSYNSFSAGLGAALNIRF